MKIELDFDDCWKGVVEHLSRTTYTPKQQSDLVDEVQSRAYELLDLVPYEDMAKSIVLWLDKSNTLRERVIGLIREEEAKDE